MNGRAEVSRLKQRLDATFKRVEQVQDAPELQSDLARYLVVQVVGYVDSAVHELILEHCRRHANPSIQKYVEQQTGRVVNIRSGRLLELLGSFDSDWEEELCDFLDPQRRDALNSIVELRNNIAHGGSAPVTYQRVSDYFRTIQKIVERVADICAPKS